MMEFNNKNQCKAFLVVFKLAKILTFLNLFLLSEAVILPNGEEVPAVIAFGDSIVDPGNNNYINTIARCNFPPYGKDFPGGKATGRFSNGKIPTDLFAELLGIKELLPAYLDPTLTTQDLLTGVSFGSGVAGYDPVSAALLATLSLDAQLNLFKEYQSKVVAAVGQNRTAEIISKSMYLVCAGSNDVTDTYFATPFRKPFYNMTAYADLLKGFANNFVKELYSMGARKIGVFSVPKSGCLPSARTLFGGLFRTCVPQFDQLALLFNSKLQETVVDLNKNLTGAKLAYIDLYQPLAHLINNGSEYGFQVVNRGCCGTGLFEASILCNPFDITCKNDSQYIFWDAFHPTQRTYQILVNGLVNTTINDLYN
ncbi:GDSL esterase/lipase-like protein [Drosera capensis]